MTTNYQLKDNILSALKKKSLDSDKEICGFIKFSNDCDEYFEECENLHPDPFNYFLISPRQYIQNQNSILFHSHPKHCKSYGFSDWDLENQKYFTLDMLLYSVNDDKFYFKKYD